ncbi:MAG: ABC transporter permease [Chloroflexi bacterium]|nr:ABC transporter permease [Chloroflexota bacterium]
MAEKSSAWSPAELDLEGTFAPIAQRSLWLDALERLVRNKLAVFGLLVAALIFFIAIFGPMLTPYDPFWQDLQNVEQAPTAQHLFGTDELGRDLFSRILYGARTAVLVATMVTGISAVLGVLLGAIGAYVGGIVDTIIMRTADIFMGFPHLLLAVFINATAKPPVAAAMTSLYKLTGWEFLSNRLLVDYLVVFGALALVEWYGIARLVRGQILSLREKEFILAEQVLGIPSRDIILHHLVPNSLGPVIVAITVGFGGAMLRESSLSYLGVGIQPPGASWGAMISDNLNMWRYKPHLILMPGLVLALAVLAFNFLGDGLNDALNPRQRRR